MFAKIWVQHDQGGAIGLAFKLFDEFFFVIQVLGVVIERVVVRTCARTSNVTNGSDDCDRKTKIKQTMFRNKL